MTGHLVAQELPYFQEVYLKVRRAEGRLYRDDEVSMFPHVSKDHPYYEEWKARKASLAEMNKYISTKIPPIRILEVGCGNGWMANSLAQNKHVQIVSLELHELEAEQALRVFGDKGNLKFQSVNSFLASPAPEGFDIILFSGSFHYFGNAGETLREWMQFLNPGGEIHIKDTLIHADKQHAERIGKSVRSYYRSIGVEPMGKYIAAYCWEDFDGFNYTNYNRHWLAQLRRSILLQANLTFPWLIIPGLPKLAAV